MIVTDDRNCLILIRGLPGSGKSTFAKKLISDSTIPKSFVHFEADQYFVDANGNYSFDPSVEWWKLPKAHKSCEEKTFSGLVNGKNVIVSNTFVRMKEMKPYIEYAEDNNHPVFVLRMTKEYGSIHGVPDFTIEKMKRRFADYPGEIFINE